MQFNGSTDLDDFRLQLTNGGLNEAGSAFYATPVNIQYFTTNFTFQLSNPAADGITFTIQNNGPTALGTHGGGLGYAGIPNSVAIKFDLFNNAGEGPNSTGLYINGAYPTVPAINLTGTGINLHSGDYFNATMTYDGTTLTMTLTDAITLATWSQSFTINIPAIVGGNTAYVGFTGGTGALTSSQKVTSWTYTPGPPLPNYPAGFASGGMTLNGGAVLNGTGLHLTDGNAGEARSAFFTNPVNVQQFTTSFDFQLTNADRRWLHLHHPGGRANLPGSRGGVSRLSAVLPNDVVVKFDLYNNAGEGPDSTGLYTNGATSNGSRHRPYLDGDQSAQRRHLQRADGLQRRYADRGHHRYRDQCLGDPDLHRQYPRDRRRPDRLCGIYGRQRRSDRDPGDTELEL